MDNITDGQFHVKLNGHIVFDPFSLSFAKDMNSILVKCNRKKYKSCLHTN